MPHTQRALIIERHPGPFIVGTVPVYTPGPGQLLIKVHAAALNPADWKVHESGFAIKRFPAILGLDRAGEVVQVGEGVSRFSVGDRVVTASAFIQNEFQGFQQFALADAAYTCKIPSHISYDQAATFPIALGTAYIGLFAELPHGAGLEVPPTSGNYGGKSILVLGGASSVGQFTIQLAKLSGFSTIIATASLKNEHLLKGLGTTHVIDRSLSGSALVSAVSSITSNHAVDVVYDTIAVTATATQGIDIISHWHLETKEKGIFVTADPFPSEEVTKHIALKVGIVHGGPGSPLNNQLLGELYQEKLFGWLETGGIKPNRLEVLEGGLAAIPEGVLRLKNNQVSGSKLVVHPQETLD